MASIGEQIKDARKAKGLTQDGLAEAMNVSRQAVSHWETNRTMPDAETLIRLSKTLKKQTRRSMKRTPLKRPA